MKKFFFASMVIVGFVLLMILPGVVFYVIGTLADKAIPNRKGGADVR